MAAISLRHVGEVAAESLRLADDLNGNALAGGHMAGMVHLSEGTDAKETTDFAYLPKRIFAVAGGDVKRSLAAGFRHRDLFRPRASHAIWESFTPSSGQIVCLYSHLLTLRRVLA
ncbi:hypothetical protein HPP92_007316 [Vanilla planifolia]|uniref:Uncharacterized protein n=1 Tax=Vanilla planifolia TaxID=51239 RepID=A0A835RHB2_VANPL|nr:hypothetical protein HPP92_007316 [Vanilla planifolia]